MANWERIREIQQGADRDVCNGIAMAHSLKTPDFVELGLLLIDARYEEEAQQRETKRLQDELRKLSNHPAIMEQSGTSDADRAARVINKQQGQITTLQKADFYWDDRELDHAHESVSEATAYDERGDIVPLRPIHELATVYVLIEADGHRVFGSREAAAAERGE